MHDFYTGKASAGVYPKRSTITRVIGSDNQPCVAMLKYSAAPEWSGLHCCGQVRAKVFVCVCVCVCASARDVCENSYNMCVNLSVYTHICTYWIPGMYQKIKQSQKHYFVRVHQTRDITSDHDGKSLIINGVS
jgi:hypothetical protein